MKIRLFFISVLFIVLCGCLYFLYSFNNEYSKLSLEYESIQEKINKYENDKLEYSNKQKELEDLKVSKQDKVSKYEEVEKWNQEIKQYLD